MGTKSSPLNGALACGVLGDIPCCQYYRIQKRTPGIHKFPDDQHFIMAFMINSHLTSRLTDSIFSASRGLALHRQPDHRSSGDVDKGCH
jgi:hypothetical protein